MYEIYKCHLIREYLDICVFSSWSKTLLNAHYKTVGRIKKRLKGHCFVLFLVAAWLFAFKSHVNGFLNHFIDPLNINYKAGLNIWGSYESPQGRRYLREIHCLFFNKRLKEFSNNKKEQNGLISRITYNFN